MDQWLKENLACPRDHTGLVLDADRLSCTEGHSYRVVAGVPVMLLDEVAPTHFSIAASLEKAASQHANNGAAESADIADSESDDIDPYVQKIIVDTCGNLYETLRNKLTRYPIPTLRLPRGSGECLLDIGCNWGRWSIAAARNGYVAVGIDTSLDAVLAARKVSSQMGVSPRFLVADARFLPFGPGRFDIVFSYSVLQHFSKENAALTLKEVARVLKSQGVSLIQLPNTYGIRCLYHQFRQRFREEREFQVRWWSLREMRDTFTSAIGKTSLSVDGYFGLGIQESDIDLLAPKYRFVVRLSEALRRMSEKAGWMKYFADSIYVRSTRSSPGSAGILPALPDGQI